MPSLSALHEVELHVIAKVIESEFAVRPVGDVGVVGNVLLIVVLTVLINVIMAPLRHYSIANGIKMAKLSPEMRVIQERYRKVPALDPKRQEMQQEMMRIYREEKVNPLGGCLPILVQMPFFIALYWVLLSSVEMRGAPWIGWIKDLSQPDTLFGVLPLIQMPIGLLPILMTATSLLQTWLNPTPPDPVQARMMWIMPLMFSVMFFFFPAGLVLYWITNNVLSIAQQWLINTRMGVPPEFNLPKFGAAAPSGAPPKPWTFLACPSSRRGPPSAPATSSSSTTTSPSSATATTSSRS